MSSMTNEWLTRRMRVGLMGLLFLIQALLASTHAQWTEADFLDPEQAFPWTAEVVSPDTVVVRWDVAPGYYLYRDQFAFTAPGQTLVPEFPQGLVKYDPTFNKELETYSGALLIPLRWSEALAGGTVVSLRYQGCADAGLCYPPQTAEFTLHPASSAAALPSVELPRAERAFFSFGGWSTHDDVGLASALEQGLRWQVLVVFFGLGLLLSLTPCVLPMVPILSAFLVGQSAGGSPSRGKGLGLSALYVLGMSVVYTAIGVLAGLTGESLAASLQTPWILSVFAVLLVLLALSMFDVFTFQAPVRWQTALNTWSQRLPGGSASAAVLLGAVSALIVGPCVAAPLAGILLYISQTQDVVLGGLALFFLAWGMGVPLLLAGASAGTLLPKAGPWMESVKQGFGLMLLAVAWWMLWPVLSGAVQMLGWAVLAFLTAGWMGAFTSLAHPASLSRRFLKALGLLIALGGVVQIIGVASGGRDPWQPLAGLHQTAVQSGSGQEPSERSFARIKTVQDLERIVAASEKPVLLDFYADWCVSCREMEAFTFTDPVVQRQLGQFTLLQADVTANDAADKALLKRFRLFGPPGIVFFDEQGRELRQRVIGFQAASRFTDTLDQVLNAALR